MKRITSFLLAIVLFAGLVLTGAPTAHAASEMTVSDELIGILKKEEGFSAKPYWDYGQYTVGYGTRCPDDMLEEYKENGISEKEAETLLRNYLSGTEAVINKKFIDKYGLTLTQSQFDALITFTYNLGSSWVYDTTGTFHNAVKNGTTGSELIRAFSLWCSAGGTILPGLVRRRLCEANMYLNGTYSITKPSNYGYVYYNANGGSVSYRIQGYDANEGVAPAYTPIYSGHTFLGWYTAKTGGEKVTALTMAHSGDTLYARWDSTETETETVPTEGITVQVTGTDVNLRKGPGTNYGIVGTANKGDELVITETASGSGYEWGKAGEKWIALKYTNYDQAVKEQEKAEEETTEPTETTEATESTDATESTETTETSESVETSETTETTEATETTAPEATVPETTVPETTVPETTVPETTVPETTVPETTVPETTEPANTTVTGTVKANGGLAVRKGPGTGYARIKYLKNGSKVTVTEQKKVGTMTWGKISAGWISMSYVVLDKVETVPETTVPETTVPETTVPETTVPETTVPETTKPANTTVTGKVKAVGGLAVRKGPGTNYARIKYIANGSKVTITEQKKVGSTTWGKISAGWISMKYVVLDQVATVPETTVPATTVPAVTVPETTVPETTVPETTVPETTVPETTVPETTVPETTVPETTVPETTVPETTVPETTVPETTVPETTVPETTVPETTAPAQTSLTGKVKANGGLSVRKGPGTSYAVKKYLSNGSKVTITEVTEVKGTKWGKVSDGWICMDYVILDGQTGTSTAVTKTITADCLRVRQSTSTSAKIVGYYYRGARVTILETKKVGGTTWGRTSKGWISMAYVK